HIVYAAANPVLFALCTDRETARQMIDAAQKLAATGRRVLVKEHPMAPSLLPVPSSVERVTEDIDGVGGLAAIVYAASTIGLEAMAAGVPAFRFLPERIIALDPLPAQVPQKTLTTA